MRRRALLQHGLALGPLATAVLAACGEAPGGPWPEGMLPIRWDRDTCARCGMVISDRRYAAQVRGGPKQQAFSFDDIGCAMSWCAEKQPKHPWLPDAATRYWVADGGSGGTRWLDARAAHFVPGPRSPMGYDLLAQATPQPGSLGFAAMGDQVVKTWPAGCRPAEAARAAAAGAP